MNHIWDVKRIRLEHLVEEAVLDLFEHMGTPGAFRLQIDHTTPKVYIIAGDANALRNLADMKEK